MPKIQTLIAVAVAACLAGCSDRAAEEGPAEARYWVNYRFERGSARPDDMDARLLDEIRASAPGARKLEVETASQVFEEGRLKDVRRVLVEVPGDEAGDLESGVLGLSLSGSAFSGSWMEPESRVSGPAVIEVSVVGAAMLDPAERDRVVEVVHAATGAERMDVGNVATVLTPETKAAVFTLRVGVRKEDVRVLETALSRLVREKGYVAVTSPPGGGAAMAGRGGLIPILD